MGINRMNYYKGFTLIELLIVVAIIAILAAIAIPNFLAAQTRAKVSRAKAEMRTLATALESYDVDNNTYPPAHYILYGVFGFGWATPDLTPYYLPRLVPLTTPIAYITSIPFDPFNPGIDRSSGADWSRGNNNGRFGSYVYYTSQEGDVNFLNTSFNNPPTWITENSSAKWRLASYGPIRKRYFTSSNYTREAQIGITENEYDPTNGTVSNGFITRIGP